MTIIAFDGTLVSADRAGFFGNLRSPTTEEKLFILGQHVYGFCGQLRLMPPLLDWVRNGADPKNFPSFLEADQRTSSCLLRFNQHGECTSFSADSPYPEEEPKKWAWGSGEQIAIGAMAAGADAPNAVNIVQRYHPFTGNGIQTINVLLLEEVGV